MIVSEGDHRNIFDSESTVYIGDYSLSNDHAVCLHIDPGFLCPSECGICYVQHRILRIHTQRNRSRRVWWIRWRRRIWINNHDHHPLGCYNPSAELDR
ncbi:hypothetical protein CHS0354_041895 [Potamilus streckersoni]|uniref:Uncharacterized protein n=1 Tax=Potamilus streckersoni TaxID=2493646 RepID=A0AAE0STQ7_9BIVA|nr:hypothetical protein CHS0354_041895 [Potamilus streckersoni]